MWGIIFSIIAGITMSVQGVFNTELSKKVGQWETVVLTQAIALVTAIVVLLFIGDGNFRNLKDANKLYLLAGVLGTLITFTVIKGMSSLGPAVAVSIILVAQLIAAALITHFGWFGSKAYSCGIRECIGVIIMIAGIIIFKWKG
ncbi:DMT family transporter [Clostridium sp.]|uniref:DMT family transporter n=1 Tax=Clostridium sp. TaxID=1506 RepID=UPI0032162B0B